MNTRSPFVATRLARHVTSSSPLYMVMLALLFFAGLSGSTHLASAQSGPTDINVGSTVKTPHVQRLGINLSGQSFYDSGQMLRNLIQRNPGFEGETWRSIIRCKTISGDGCYGDDPWSSWPKDFLVGASVQFVTGASKGLTGTVTGLDPASTSANVGFLVHMSGLAHAPTAGDFFIVQATVPGNPQAGWWPGTSGGASLTADTTDLAPNSPGKQALQINASGTGQSAGVTSYFDSMNGRSFVQLNGTYTVTFRAKSLGGSNSINVSVMRPTSHGNMTYLNQNVSLTNAWKDYSLTFTANEDGTYIGTAQVGFNVSGGTVLLDDATMMEEAAPDNPTAFRNAVVDRLRQLKPGTLRYMDNGTDFGSTNDNMIAVPFARQRAGYSLNQNKQEDIPIGLEEFLELCQAIGADPWYTVPAGTSPQEFQQLLQFLNGSATTKYGAIRASLGQSAPWTSVFNTIHLELGNETWNAGSFPGATFQDPAAYGNRVQDVFSAAKAAPEYNASKFDLVMNGFGAWVDYNRQELATGVSTADTLDIAPYIFSHIADWGSNEAIFGPMFGEPEAIDSLSTGYVAQDVQVTQSAPHPVKLAVYEVNMGAIDGTAPQSTVNAVLPSVGAGLATVEHMLLMMRDNGITTQNLFALPEYANGYTNTNGGGGTVPLWGSVVDMGGQTNLCRPQFLAETLANSAITGDLLETVQTGANPTWDQPMNPNTKVATPNAHYLQSFAFSDGTNHSVVVFNLHRTSALPVTFSGANAPHGTVQIARLTSNNLTDTNEQTNIVAPTTAQVSNFDPTAVTSLPPFSMTVFSWTGNGSIAPSPESTTSVLTATPAQTTAGQTVTLQASVTAASGTPDGTVTLTDGSTTLGTASLSNGTASISTSTLSAGTHSITLAYGGNSSFQASTSQPVTVTVTAVTAAATTTQLNATPTQATVGQTVTLSATVAATTGTPSGTVNFLQGGGQVLGTAALVNGRASVALNSLLAGSHSLTAQFVGTSAFAASTSSATVVNVAAAVVSTTAQLSASTTRASVGQPVTLTAVVSSPSGTPDGLVNFLTKQTVIGTTTLSAGRAVLTTSSLALGSNPISVSYPGTASYASSVSSTVNVTVTGAATTTSLGLSATQVTAGSPLTLTAKVSPDSGPAPTGTVMFYQGNAKLGSVNLANGVATLSTNAPAKAGSYQVSAQYAGSPNDSASASAQVSFAVVVVAPATLNTVTTLAVNPANAITGQTGVLSAMVTPTTGTTIPSGLVHFLLGTTDAGTATLVNGTASLPITAPAAGSYLLQARYEGSTADNASTSASLTWNVAAASTAPAPPTGTAPVATATTLALSNSTVTAGVPVTLSMSVASADGKTVPSGSLVIAGLPASLAPIPLVNGQASLPLTIQTTGPYTLQANFIGDGVISASSSSTPVLLTVTAAPQTQPVPTPVSGGGSIALSLSAQSVRLTSSQTSSLTVQVTPQGDFQQTVQLSCQGLPANIACSFATPALAVAGQPSSTTMMLATGASTTARNSLPGGLSGIAYGAMLPWNLIGMLSTAAARRRRQWGTLRTICLFVLMGAGALAMTGCGVTYGTTAQTYHATVTASVSGSVLQTASFDVVVQQKTAPF